jgi:oxygen-independent coproporphyrinogen-3 oxidase
MMKTALMPTGVYISVPFCRTKCTFCNFASDVFSRSRMQIYVDRICADIDGITGTVADLGAEMDRAADSIYLGGGTPSTLAPPQLRQMFQAVREQFEVAPEAEVTVECAPGTLSSELIETLVGCGVNRVSLGVQSFVDPESSSVGRLHTRAVVLEDIARLRTAGISEINVDLIAGLPHQTEQSWRYSLDEAIATGVPHVSVYILEVDEDSRLGRELIAGGQRYHAHYVPDAGLTAEFYSIACERLTAAGIGQYEISNFASKGHDSQHNLKYWTRRPYVGFGVDAHSMLWRKVAAPRLGAVRFATQDSLEEFSSAAVGTHGSVEDLDAERAIEEEFFLGLRLARGVDLREIAEEFGTAAVRRYEDAIRESVADGLLDRDGALIALTPRGRLLSNEVFERFISLPSERGF